MLIRSRQVLSRRILLTANKNYATTNSRNRIIGKQLDLFHGRSNLQTALSVRGSMKTFIQVLSHPTSDNTEPCILLQTLPGNKYVIGKCSEGLQRSLHQSKTKMGKLKGIFLTGTINWKSMGGLPGFLLTVGEQGARRLTLQSAGENLGYACSTWRKFMFHNQIDAQIALPDSSYQDDYVIISGVAIKPLGYKDSETPQEKFNYTVQQTKAQLEETTPDRRSSCYIIQITPSRGKFLVKRAKELGVTPGASFSKLTRGEVVVTDAGVTVRPEDVIEPPKTPPRVLVIDCPGPEYVDGVITEDWEKPVSRKKRKNGQDAIEEIPVDIKVVYHFLGRDVDPFSDKYFNWMINSFGKDCLHQISHPKYAPNGIMLESAALLNMKLRYHMSKAQFPRLHTADSEQEFPASCNKNIQPMHTMEVIGLEPEVYKVSGVNNLAMKYGKVDWDETEKAANIYKEEDTEEDSATTEPKVISIGTGSSIPSKYRNVVSTIVRDPEVHEAVMFDCGEGTLGNLRRLYSQENLTGLFQDLKTVYISHLHADHHLGTLSVIQEWILQNPDSGKKLNLIAPWSYYDFFIEWQKLEPEIPWAERVNFIEIETFLVGQGFRGRPGGKLKESHSSNIEAKCCKAYHCEYSYSVNMKVGRIHVAYSGDTRPNEYFAVNVGKDCDLLIHEATHDNELLEEAKAKRHSTFNEALEIGGKMKAKHILLTHFSQRYPKIPELDNSNERSAPVAIGFDGMHLRLSQIKDQIKNIGPVQEMFAKEAETDNDDTIEKKT